MAGRRDHLADRGDHHVRLIVLDVMPTAQGENLLAVGGEVENGRNLPRTIRAESQFGRGSTFVVSLPLAQIDDESGLILPDER